MTDVVAVRVTHHRVFAEDIEGFDFAIFCSGDHLSDSLADLSGKQATPQAASNFWRAASLR
jgi:hypothetical protein